MPLQHLQQAARLLEELGTLGVEEREEAACVILKAFFPPHSSPQYVAAQFEAEAHRHQLEVVSLRCGRFLFDPDQWVESCKESFRGFPVGRTFYIHPPWEPPGRLGKRIGLLIEPGNAFGTGTHESTQLALMSLPRVVNHATSLLDVGTGSAILSIAAHKLNPSLQVVALDTDPDAVAAAQENCRRNLVENIFLIAGSISALNPTCVFDVVVANLTAMLLSQMEGSLTRLSRKDLIVSGFTKEEAPDVLECFQGLGGKLKKERAKNGWLCFHFDVASGSRRQPSARSINASYSR